MVNFGPSVLWLCADMILANRGDYFQSLEAKLLEFVLEFALQSRDLDSGQGNFMSLAKFNHCSSSLRKRWFKVRVFFAFS